MGPNKIAENLRDKYLVRSKRKSGRYYNISAANKRKMDDLIEAYEESLGGKLTIKRNKVIKDTKNIVRYVNGFRKRIFHSQKKDVSFFHLYKELVSDHLPVSLTCGTSQKDDD